MNFPLGTTYYFCHAGNAPDYPAGGTITATGQLTVVEHTQSFAGLCPGRSNAWIGLQGSDGHDYYSNQVDLQRPATPGASVSASNNNGQMFVQFTGFPLGTTYYFCHSGNSSDYPTGGVITAHGQITISSSNQSFASGLCSGRGNAWIGIQASDNHDYYSNQVDLYAPATPGASIAVFGSAGQMSLQVSGFPTGTTYYFCHAGDPSQYPTGGSIIGHGQINVSAPNQTFGPLCSGSGNAWIGIQATDGHDYYSNQITL
jgi:YHS domain-containing protein